MSRVIVQYKDQSHMTYGEEGGATFVLHKNGAVWIYEGKNYQTVLAPGEWITIDYHMDDGEE